LYKIELFLVCINRDRFEFKEEILFGKQKRSAVAEAESHFNFQTNNGQKLVRICKTASLVPLLEGELEFLHGTHHRLTRDL
jgi:hypothetical protein